jgi:hypothetical protein
MSNATLNARQIRYLNALIFYHNITTFKAIGLEGQIALLFMNNKIETYEALQPLVDDFLSGNK